MRITVLIAFCLPLVACGKPPTAQDGFDAIASNNYTEAAAIFQRVAAAQTGCDRAQSLAAQSAAIAAESLKSVLEDIPEAEGVVKAGFDQAYEGAIASSNRLGGCAIPSL